MERRMRKLARLVPYLAGVCLSFAAKAGPQTYYLLAPETFNGNVAVVSLEPGNLITVGNYSLTLDQYQSASIPNARLFSGVAIAGTKAFSLGSDPDATDLLVPAQFAGTSFVVPHVAGQHRYYLMTTNPAGAIATLTIGASSSNIPLTANSVVEVDGGSDNAVAARITATQDILVAHVGVVSGAVRDAFPVPPAAASVVGLRSQLVTLAASADSTSGTVYASDGTSAGFSLNAGQQVAVTVGTNGTQGQGTMLRVDANNPVMAVQTDDGDGSDATAFWPSSLHTRSVALPVNAQYLAVACTSASVTVTLYRGATAPDSQTCSGSSTNPGKVYFGSATNGVNLPAGWYLQASADVYAVYEAAAQDDEHNLLGVTLPAGPAAPTLTAPTASTSSNPLAITGSSVANAPIRIFVNNKLAATGIADGSGAFAINTPLVDGLNVIYATALTGANESAASNTVSTTYTNGISRTQSGSIGVNTVWTPGNPATPYVISANLTVAAGVELVLQPGTTLKMANNVIIATNGTLRIHGEAGNPVVLTCNAATCTKGIWNGIDALAATSNVQISYATIEWASTGVEINGGIGSVRNSTIRNFSTNGVWVQNVSTSTVIANNLIDNLNDTVDCIEASSGSPTISGNTLTNCDNGINVFSNSSPVINGNNIITGNNYGVRVNGNTSQSPQPLINGNQIFANDNYNLIASGFASGAQNLKVNATGNWWGTTTAYLITPTISDWSDSYTSTTIPVIDFAYFLDGLNGSPIQANYLNGPFSATTTTLTAGATYEVLGYLQVSAGKTLNIPAGVTLRVHGNMMVVSFGTLNIQGTSGSPVVITSGRPTPARGNWEGVRVQSNNTLIDYATIEWAVNGVHLNGAAGMVRNSTIRNFSGTGVAVAGAAASGTLIQNNLIDDISRPSGTSCIHINASSPTIQGNTLTNCVYGVYVHGVSTPLVNGNNVITANTHGVYADGVSGTGAQPVVTGNRLYGNVSYNYNANNFGSGGSGIQLNATGNWWGTTDPTTIAAKINDLSDSYTSSEPTVNYSGYLDGPNGNPMPGNPLMGKLTGTTTLTANTTYDVLGVLFVNTGATLTIPAGATLRFHGNAFLVVDGTLTVQGTSGSPVTLTSGRASPARGDWTGVLIRSTATNALIDYATIEWAVNGVHLNGAAGMVRNSTIRNFSGTGVAVAGAAASGTLIQNNLIDDISRPSGTSCIHINASSPTIQGNTLTNCVYGVYVHGVSTPLVNGNNVITANTHGVYADGVSGTGAQPVVTGNRLYGNVSYNYNANNFGSGGSGIQLNATGNWWGTTDPTTIAAKINDLSDSYTSSEPTVNYSGYLDGPNGNPMPGNPLMGKLTGTTTLTANTTYDVLGVLFVNTGATLTIPAGATLRFHGNAFLVVDGTLTVQGTSGSPVTLTSGRASPARGDWHGVLVRASGSVIDYALIEWTTDGVTMSGVTATVRNSTIRNFTSDGILVSGAGASGTLIQNNLIDNFSRPSSSGCISVGSSSPTIQGNTLTRCANGLYVNGTSAPQVNGNNVITANTHGVYADGVSGTGAQPVVTGNQLYGNVSYDYNANNFGSGGSGIQLNATGNWWGTTDPTTIAAKINDLSDSYTSSEPTVNYSGYLDGPNGNPVPGNPLMGKLTGTTTLTANTTYDVLGVLFVNPGVTLTVPAGATLRFHGNASLVVDGTLTVQGTSGSPVTLTSGRANPARGDWTGIAVRAGASVTIDYATIEHAIRGIEVVSATAVIRNVRIFRYSVAGVSLTSVLAGSELRDSLIDNFGELNGSTTYGVYVASCSPLIIGNRIQGTRLGVYVTGGSSPTITNNVIRDGLWGIYLQGNGANTAAGNPNPVINANDFYNNSTAQLQINNYGGSNPIVINATGNYWGTATPVIGTHIKVSGGAVAAQINFSGYSSSSLNGTAASSLTVSDLVFSPNGDAVQETTALASTLSQSASWSLTVRAPTGGVVREYTGTGTAVAVTWDGLDASSQVVPDGIYQFELANTAAGQILAANSSTVDNVAPLSAIAAPANNAVLTNVSVVNLLGNALDPHFLNYVLEYGAGTTPSSWINIKTATTQVQSAELGSLTVVTQNGSVAITGPNVFRLRVTDTAGNASTATAAVTVDNVAASAITQNLHLIRPVLGEQLTVNFTLAGPATASLQIYPDLGGPMVREVSQVFASGGAKTLSWDGRDAVNNLVPEEAYRFVLHLVEGARVTDYDPPDIDNVGSNSGTVDATFNANANDFFKMNLNVSDLKARVRMRVSGCTPTAHYPYNWVPFVQGATPIMWDGRDANGALATGVCDVYFDAPDPLRPFSVIVKGTKPQITGKRASPNLEVGAEPYIVVHSYDQIGRFTYRVSLDSNVTVKLLPPGVTDFADSGAITLVNNVFQTAQSGGLPADYVVEWTGNDGVDTNNILVSAEGTYTIAIQATSTANGQSSLYRGSLQLYQ
jgi:parallel beta-helix repeat protein